MSKNSNLEQTSFLEDLFGMEEEAEVVVLDATPTEETVEETAVGSDIKNGVEKENTAEPTEEEKKAADAEKKLSTFEEPKKNDKKAPAKGKTATPPKKQTVGDDFKLKADTLVKYAGQEVAVTRYFTAEQIAKGLERKVKGETKVEPIGEKDLVKKLNDDFAELMPDLTALVYYEKENIVVPVLTARTKGADVAEIKESSEKDSFSKKKRVPFRLLSDFVAVARHFSRTHGTEIHADVYYDCTEKAFFMDFPKQLVHKYWVTVTEEPFETATKLIKRKYRKVMEIHSHHVMDANPSAKDNESERSPILYAIVGRVHDFFPEVTLRTFNSATQKHIPFKMEQVFESPFNNNNPAIDKYDLSGVEVSN